MLSCKDVSALATDYMENRLPWHRRIQVRLHLAMCRFCRRYLEQLELTRRALRALPPPQVPEGLRERAREAFLAWKQARKP